MSPRAQGWSVVIGRHGRDDDASPYGAPVTQEGLAALANQLGLNVEQYVDHLLITERNAARALRRVAVEPAWPRRKTWIVSWPLQDRDWRDLRCRSLLVW